MKRVVRAALVLGIIIAVGVWLNFEWTQFAPQKVKANPVSSAAATAKTSQAEQAAKVQKESSQIQTMLQNFASQYPGQISLVAVDMDNGATGSANANTQMVSASLYKVFVAYGIYQKIDDGSLTIQNNVPEVGESVGACLEKMIEVSDNDCGKALGDIVGWQMLDDKLKTLGLTATELNNYDDYGNVNGDKITTAADVATFMQQLYAGTLLGQTSTAAFITLLKNDQVNDRLPSGLPAGTVIAHKTGDLDDVVHDAGFVYAPNGTYLIVMMTQGWDAPATQAPPVFTDLSKQVWAYFAS